MKSFVKGGNTFLAENEAVICVSAAKQTRLYAVRISRLLHLRKRQYFAGKSWKRV